MFHRIRYISESQSAFADYLFYLRRILETPDYFILYANVQLEVRRC